MKARRDGHVVSVAVIVAVGVNGGGRREVLGLAIGTSEAETFWTDFLRKLVARQSGWEDSDNQDENPSVAA